MEQAFDLRDPVKQGRGAVWECCGTNEGNGKRESARLSVDDEIATRLTALSVQEREAVLEEIHGVAPQNDETPEAISSLLAMMKEEIVNTPDRNKRAFLKAAFLRPSLENDDALHLRFLRAERYDAKEAAAQLCLFFEHKFELFPESLHRRIIIDDLDADVVETQRIAKVGTRGHRVPQFEEAVRVPHLVFPSQPSAQIS